MAWTKSIQGEAMRDKIPTPTNGLYLFYIGCISLLAVGLSQNYESFNTVIGALLSGVGYLFLFIFIGWGIFVLGYWLFVVAVGGKPLPAPGPYWLKDIGSWLWLVFVVGDGPESKPKNIQDKEV